LLVSDLTPRALRRQLHGSGLRLRTGPVVTRIRSRLDAVADGISLHYANHAAEDGAGFADFDVSVERPQGFRRWIAPQVVFNVDEASSFAPLPGDQGFPMLEWGLNWCISSHCHQFLIVHAAVLERGGKAVLLPAPSGSGKSTLCAALAFSGWRLLSDELALLDPQHGHVVPLPRPISLKNESIEVIRAFAPRAALGPVVRETLKGSVAHARPPEESVSRDNETALPAWVIVPRFSPGSEACLAPMPKARAFMGLVASAFNYNVHGREGFRTLTRLVDEADCYQFSYGRLEDAIPLFDRLGRVSKHNERRAC
jgi:HprK-related kinase A